MLPSCGFTSNRLPWAWIYIQHNSGTWPSTCLTIAMHACGDALYQVTKVNPAQSGQVHGLGGGTKGEQVMEIGRLTLPLKPA